jgi:hypothetical protein
MTDSENVGCVPNILKFKTVGYENLKAEESIVVFMMWQTIIGTVGTNNLIIMFTHPLNCILDHHKSFRKR